jgi:nucleoside-diphosphate-sugar epimerase
MKTALLVGGTAATGVTIAAELRRLGYEVTIYHTGRHELPELDDLEHIHGDPHFKESISADLADRTWDVTVATYGRVRHIADTLRGRTGHFVSISGMPAIAPMQGVPLTEESPYEDPECAPAGLRRLLPKIIETEREILAAGRSGDFASTVVRYPYVYGPHSIVPMEWHVIRRVLDGRIRWAAPAGGLAIRGRCASANAARLVAKILERPEAAAGEIFHAADSRQFTLREWIEIIAKYMGHSFEFIDIPPSIVPLTSSAMPMAGEFTWARSPDVEQGRLRLEVVSNQKARDILGYEDAVAPGPWIQRTVDYWLENPPTVDGLDGRLKPEEFDYRSEDQLLAYWDSIARNVPNFGVSLCRDHAYSHPKAPAGSGS